jgi:hypothetical protein
MLKAALAESKSPLKLVKQPAKVFNIKNKLKIIPQEDNVWFDLPTENTLSTNKRVNISPVYNQRLFMAFDHPARKSCKNYRFVV